jgi:hypothetical protein
MDDRTRAAMGETRIKATRHCWREGFPVSYIARIYHLTEPQVLDICLGDAA